MLDFSLEKLENEKNRKPRIDVTTVHVSHAVVNSPLNHVGHSSSPVTSVPVFSSVQHK